MSSWPFALAWTLLAAAYTFYSLRRSRAQQRELQKAVQAQQAKRETLGRQVAEAKSHGGRIEAEQKEVQAIYALVKGLAEAVNWEDIKPKLETAVSQFLGLDEFSLFVADLHERSALHPLVNRRLGNSMGASWETLERHLQESGLPATAPHVIESPERAVAVPIRESEEMMGYLYARVPASADPQNALRKAVAFAGETAFAFRRLKLFQEVERLSQIDGLTGIARRGVLDQRLQDEQVRAKTFKTSFCLMILDIDHFKRLNDSYGHQFGDQVLKRVGELLKASIYETDFVARYGGEEFAILMPRAEPAGVLRKAEAVRAAIEKEAFPLGLETIHVTVSIGVAHFPRDGASVAELVRRADEALYHAKESGRNRVVDIAQVPR